MNKIEFNPNFMRDERGAYVPVSTIREIDMLRDRLVRDLTACAKEHSLALAEFKRAAFGDIAAFAQISAEQYHARIGGEEGNITLFSFDRRYKIQRVVAKTLSFGEQLQAAKALIDECIRDWSAGSRDEIRVLINDAFQVDQTGKVNTDRILGLRRLRIDDRRWLNAMQAISDALTVIGSKSYIRVYERDERGEYLPISLDVAAA